MISVTAVTAILLWRTLKSQKDVRQTQNRLLDIVYLRLREDYRPELDYPPVEIGAVAIDIKYLISVGIRNKSANPVKNPRVRSFKSEQLILRIDNLKEVLRQTEYQPMHLFFKADDRPIKKAEFEFVIEYEDMVGFRYEQLIKGVNEFKIGLWQHKLNPMEPKLIKS